MSENGKDLQALMKAGVQPIRLPEGEWNIPTPVMNYIRKLESDLEAAEKAVRREFEVKHR